MKIGKYNIPSKTAIMGILNVTPDSFSDGGRYQTLDKSLLQVDSMLTEGASVIDVGGESTRPGYKFVEPELEIKRVIPVIKAIRKRFDCLISIDTYKVETARAALLAGANILNDVWAGLYDGKMLALSKEFDVPIILMHNQKTEEYTEVVSDVCCFLEQRIRVALDTGVNENNIWIDPGFGFSKNIDQNIDLLKGLEKVCDLGYPTLFGISRKRVVDALLGGGTKPEQRDKATATLSAWAIYKGCKMVRVHNVGMNRDIIKIIEQLS